MDGRKPTNIDGGVAVGRGFQPRVGSERRRTRVGILCQEVEGYLPGLTEVDSTHATSDQSLGTIHPMQSRRIPDRNSTHSNSSTSTIETASTPQNASKPAPHLAHQPDRTADNCNSNRPRSTTNRGSENSLETQLKLPLQQTHTTRLNRPFESPNISRNCYIETGGIRDRDLRRLTRDRHSDLFVPEG